MVFTALITVSSGNTTGLMIIWQWSPSFIDIPESAYPKRIFNLKLSYRTDRRTSGDPRPAQPAAARIAETTAGRNLCKAFQKIGHGVGRSLRAGAMGSVNALLRWMSTCTQFAM